MGALRIRASRAREGNGVQPAEEGPGRSWSCGDRANVRHGVALVGRECQGRWLLRGSAVVVPRSQARERNGLFGEAVCQARPDSDHGGLDQMIESNRETYAESDQGRIAHCRERVLQHDEGCPLRRRWVR